MKILRYIYFSVIVALIAISSVSCRFADNFVSASDNIVTKNVPTSNFSAIQLKSDADVVIRQAPVTSVKIKGSDNLVPNVIVSNSNGTLVITEHQNFVVRTMREEQFPTVYITVPSLDDISLIGSGDIRVDSVFNADGLQLSLTGSGDISIRNLSCHGNLTCNLKGSGDVDFKGEVKTDSASFYLVGSGDISGKSLVTHYFTSSLEGSGDISFHNVLALNVNTRLQGSGDFSFGSITAQTLNGILSGSGDIHINGGTASLVSFDAGGSGSVSAAALKARKFVARAAGSSSIECSPIDTLETEISNSADIVYHGNPVERHVGKNAPQKAN